MNILKTHIILLISLLTTPLYGAVTMDVRPATTYQTVEGIGGGIVYYLDWIAKKYGVEETPVTYKVKDEDTGEIRTIRTRCKAMIGSKYLMYLGKIPDDTITSVEVGHVNQFETPIKPKSKRVKEQSLVGLTPQKFGEDEVCMLNMSLGADVVARLMCLHSAAPSMSKELFTRLLKDGRPTQLKALDISTHDIINQNRNVLIFCDMMGAIGYDVPPPAAVAS